MKKGCTLDLPVEINNVLSKRKCLILSTENVDPNSEFLCRQITDPNKKNKPQFREYSNYYDKSNHSFSKCLRKQREDRHRKRNSYSRSKSPETHFIQYFKAYQNQYHPIEQPSSYPVIYYWRNSYDSRTRSTSRNRHDPYQFFALLRLQCHGIDVNYLALEIIIVMEK